MNKNTGNAYNSNDTGNLSGRLSLSLNINGTACQLGDLKSKNSKSEPKSNSLKKLDDAERDVNNNSLKSTQATKFQCVNKLNRDSSDHLNKIGLTINTKIKNGSHSLRKRRSKFKGVPSLNLSQPVSPISLRVPSNNTCNIDDLASPKIDENNRKLPFFSRVVL